MTKIFHPRVQKSALLINFFALRIFIFFGLGFGVLLSCGGARAAAACSRWFLVEQGQLSVLFFVFSLCGAAHMAPNASISFSPSAFYFSVVAFSVAGACLPARSLLLSDARPIQGHSRACSSEAAGLLPIAIDHCQKDRNSYLLWPLRRPVAIFVVEMDFEVSTMPLPLPQMHF